MTKRRYLAICPDCETRKDMAAMPSKGYWPMCMECSQLMNIYVRKREVAPLGEVAAGGKE